MWAGAIVDIPAGYVLCDGNNGTPDLRNRFIVGAGDTYDPDDTGGAAAHNHDFTSDGHWHLLTGGIFIQSGPWYKSQTNTEVDTGTTDNSSTLPPYYALAYIMKS